VFILFENIQVLLKEKCLTIGGNVEKLLDQMKELKEIYFALKE
jgi:hypothetical protein